MKSPQDTRKYFAPQVFPAYSLAERQRLREGNLPPRIVKLVHAYERLPQEAIINALANGELLTARQAAMAVDMKIGTFNYHLRKGHIPHFTPKGSRTHYVYLADAQHFAEKLATYRTLTTFEEFLDDDVTLPSRAQTATDGTRVESPTA